jgi:3-deoxy-D-manno-octulosonic-acid transferase
MRGGTCLHAADFAAKMLDHNATVVVQNAEEFSAFVRRCLEPPDYAAALGNHAQSFVRSQLGATERTLELLAMSTKTC